MPFGTRDVANRIALSDASDGLQQRLDGHVGRAERDELVTRGHMLEQIEQALAASDGHVRRLISLDTEGEGRAVISVGDLATADYVSYLIPGMFFGVDAQIAAWTDTAEALVTDQERWLARLRPGEHARGRGGGVDRLPHPQPRQRRLDGARPRRARRVHRLPAGAARGPRRRPALPERAVALLRLHGGAALARRGRRVGRRARPRRLARQPRALGARTARDRRQRVGGGGRLGSDPRIRGVRQPAHLGRVRRAPLLGGAAAPTR